MKWLQLHHSLIFDFSWRAPGHVFCMVLHILFIEKGCIQANIESESRCQEGTGGRIREILRTLIPCSFLVPWLLRGGCRLLCPQHGKIGESIVKESGI
jgi:hypothetical protein